MIFNFFKHTFFSESKFKVFLINFVKLIGRHFYQSLFLTMLLVTSLQFHWNESSHWKLFCEKCLLSCVFSWEWGALDSTSSPENKSCSAESKKTLAKLGVLLKICLFAWYIEVFWILSERENSEHPCKFKYPGKGIPTFLRHWGIPLWYLLAS